MMYIFKLPLLIAFIEYRTTLSQLRFMAVFSMHTFFHTFNYAPIRCYTNFKRFTDKNRV